MVMGWCIRVILYQNKIYDILTEIQELLPSLYPANSAFLDPHLNGYCTDAITGILQSTKSITDANKAKSRVFSLVSFLLSNLYVVFPLFLP